MFPLFLSIRYYQYLYENFWFKIFIQAKKKPGLTGHKTGVVLLFHTLARAIPSPLKVLTAEFGMGSGVSLLL